MAFRLLNDGQLSQFMTVPPWSNFSATFVCLNLAFAAICLYSVVYILKSKPPTLPLPPGPRGLPIIGNLHQEIGSDPIDMLKRHHKRYGPIIHLRFGQRSIVSINSHEIAHELINKRGAVYGSRPKLISVETFGGGLLLPLLPNGPRWRAQHAVAGKLLRASPRYHPLQNLESTQLLHELLSPQDLSKVFHRYAGSLGHALAYGSRLPEVECEEFEVLHQFVDGMNAGMTGSSMALPELFPLLDMLPNCCAPWRKAANSLGNILTAFFDRGLEAGKGRSSWSWTNQLKNIKESHRMSLKEQANLLGTLYGAGFETTPSTFMFVVLACVLHPECAQRAQRELDEVVGNDRLPTFEDASRLPYLTAFISEVMRWRPILPIGVPYATERDDEYDGYLIPKNTMILVNFMNIAFDEKAFPEPYEFRPERWLENPDAPFSAFGYGRALLSRETDGFGFGLDCHITSSLGV